MDLYKDPSRPVSERVEDLLSRMTLEEKAAQLCGDLPASFIADGKVSLDALRQKFPHGHGRFTQYSMVGIVDPQQIARISNEVQRYFVEETRLGIPVALQTENLCGYPAAGGTLFPAQINVGATWQPELAGQMAAVIGQESRAVGINSAMSPVIDVSRDPRWGRTYETYGEDPYLTGEMGVAFVKGLQGDDPNCRKVDATLKHYAVHSGPESLRHSFDVHVEDGDLYETYLWAFKYCIDHADPSAVMGAYNRVNGEPACASETLLQKILFGEFGFEGYVVSDCGAICDINRNHQVTANEAESAALAVNNGCILNCGDAYKWLKTAVLLGMISEETITASVEKLFEARFRLGMFDKDGPYDQLTDEVVESPEHLALSRKMAQESVVLLKNNGILPLDPKANVAVIGPNADDKSVLLGNYNGTPSQYITLLRGIQEAAQGKVRYARGCHIHRATVGQWEEHPLREAILAAQKSDVVILCMGLNPTIEGEEGDAYNGDMSGDKTSLDLPASQEALIEEILKVGKPTVFLNVTGSCVNLTREDQACDAVLQVFYPGAEGGKAVADILYGKVSPSGRLPVTFYHNDSELPRFTDYSMKGRTYKYFQGKPLYPFAHGLSYTEFAYENLAFDGANVTGTVKNTGAMASGHAIPVFVKDPEEEGVNCRLAGFARVELEPGQEAGFQVELCPEILSLFQEPQRLVALVGGVDGCQVNQ